MADNGWNSIGKIDEIYENSQNVWKLMKIPKIYETGLGKDMKCMVMYENVW